MCDNNPYKSDGEKIAQRTKDLVVEVRGNYPMLVNEQIWSILHPSVCERPDLTADEARIIVNWYDKVACDIWIINAVGQGYLYALPGPDGLQYAMLPGDEWPAE